MPRRGLSGSNLLVSVAAGFAVLAGGVVFAGAGEASALDIVVERPLASVQIAAGIVLWIGMLVVPAVRALNRMLVRRQVHIEGEVVKILRHTLFGIRTQSVPVKSYRGLAHHVRASLSGLTHEVVLVHADPALNVTVATAERVTETLLDHYKSLFGLPEIPARAIYEADWSEDRVGSPSGVAPAGV